MCKFASPISTAGSSCHSDDLVLQIHECDFPLIPAMPGDFFAIPGTSVSVEHLFSKSRHLCCKNPLIHAC
ncbi:hypothetical protein DFH08DRAFT_710409 [Mycena albidolilacea]|uniref:HAT C-terminal dimerisation domain-containing protein n=1 Tax=Mycena albidolilacea TaxID=1033008 RepID=A0AAD7EI86_9AGAR|nr:hypothetical protein DFH08DRAFT_710409 [Mycena albidolilacea]